MDSQRLTFRPAPDTTPRLPLGVRAVGHYRIGPPFHIFHVKHHFQLYWGIAGQGCFKLNGAEHILGENEVFLYQPGDMHDLRPLSDEWEFNFIAVDGGAAEAIITSLDLPSGIRPTGECPYALFEQLHALVPSPMPADERRASAIAFEILQRSTLRAPEESNEAVIIKDGIDQNYRDADFGIEQIAIRLRIHRSTLYRRFMRHYGVKPSDYLSRRRIAHALELLRDSRIPLAEVARLSGYKDFSYFGRVIRRATGYTPGQLRRGASGL